MEKTFTGVFEQVGGWYVAYAEELPEANTQGRTLEETRENLREAIALVLAAKLELAARTAVDREVVCAEEQSRWG